MFCTDFDKLVANLERRQFVVHPTQNAEEAKSLALSLIGGGSVGFGGSITVKEIGLYDALAARGNPVYSHWHATTPAQGADARVNAARADWYVASSNAILRDGRLVNIDGTGNRVSSMIMGPKNVLLFIGKNKLADHLDAGIARIKREACPRNARRLNLNQLPCGITGQCADCNSPQRMCRVTSILEWVPRAIDSFHLILIDQEIGW